MILDLLVNRIIRRDLATVARQFAPTDAHNDAMIEEFFNLFVKWLDYKTYPNDPARLTNATLKEKVAKLDVAESLTNTAKIVQLCFIMGSMLGRAGFKNVPPIAYEAFSELMEDGFCQGLEIAHKRARGVDAKASTDVDSKSPAQGTGDDEKTPRSTNGSRQSEPSETPTPEAPAET